MFCQKLFLTNLSHHDTFNLFVGVLMVLLNIYGSPMTPPTYFHHCSDANCLCIFPFATPRHLARHKAGGYRAASFALPIYERLVRVSSVAPLLQLPSD